MVSLLAAAGAGLDRRGGEWSTPPEQYRTAYQNAVLRNREDLVALLAELGADTTVSAGDLAVAAVARGERPATALPGAPDADAQEALILASLRGHLDLVVDLVGPRFFGHVGGGPPGMLLHHACWVGDRDVVGRLLDRGADPVAASGAEFDTPLAWAVLGSQYHAIPGRDYVGVAERLLAAGAELEPRFPDVAEGPLADWLEERV
jgi:ankyrin repeat protein